MTLGNLTAKLLICTDHSSIVGFHCLPPPTLAVPPALSRSPFRQEIVAGQAHAMDPIHAAGQPRDNSAAVPLPIQAPGMTRSVSLDATTSHDSQPRDAGDARGGKDM